jgi:hypothetical protein
MMHQIFFIFTQPFPHSQSLNDNKYFLQKLK